MLVTYLLLPLFLCVNSVFVESKLTRRKLLETLLDLHHEYKDFNMSAYDPKIPPHYEKDFPTNVSIQLYIISIDSLNEISMDFSIDAFVRQIWTDPRLAFKNLSNITRLEIDQKLMDSVWVPDTYFSNEKEAYVHDVTVPNKLLHIYQNGTVFYSMRVSMTMSCEMNLHNYPLDIQTCPITIESYGYSTQNVLFSWNTDHPVNLPDVGLPQFSISKHHRFGYCMKQYGDTGTFSCLNTTIQFVRNQGYYFAQIFVPSILIVVLSWVSFWVDPEATPARISLGVLTVLTLTTQTSGARAQLPMVSYVKAIDIWMATCMIFVFAALLEFAYINVLSRRKNRPVRTNKDCELAMIHDSTPNPMMPFIKLIDFKREARKVDRVSRVLFPTLFIVFNIGFWTYYLYLNKDNHYS